MELIMTIAYVASAAIFAVAAITELMGKAYVLAAMSVFASALNAYAAYFFWPVA